MNARKVERCATHIGTQAVEWMWALVFPALSCVCADERVRSDMLAMVEKIQKERTNEVIEMLYGYCADVIFSCLEFGMDEDALIEAMTDARVMQRRR